MKLGLKSLLIGAHQFILHPLFVYMAWIELYKHFPSIYETIAIIIHDIGYYNLDFYQINSNNDNHTLLGAKIIKCFNKNLYDMCLYHSRFYAFKNKQIPSKLCWADKYSIKYEIPQFYIFRCYLSGELSEYRKEYFTNGNDLNWFKINSQKMINIARKNSYMYKY